MTLQLTLDLDSAQRDTAATEGLGYLCLGCGTRTPDRPAGRSCPVCGGYVIDARAWDEPAWLDCLIRGEW